MKIALFEYNETLFLSISKVWDLRTKTVVHRFTGHEQDIYSLDFAPAGDFLVSGSGDRSTKVWEMETGECKFTLTDFSDTSKEGGVTSVSISPNGKYIASVSSR